jgi:5'(3')-deoxyribonucleotidase
MIIYLDMDDVVADWMPAARAIVNRSWEYGERIPDSDWDKVRAKERFYRDLPIKPGAHELVQYCRDAVNNGYADGLFFLTALPHDYSVPYASYDKVQWAQERFPDIPVFFGPFSHDKWKHCKPGDILIDDRTSNCEEWIRSGGRAHIYRTWENCKPWLEEQLNENLETLG